MNNQTIPVGLIGCGRVAQYGHLPAITHDSLLELVAVADTNAEMLHSTATEYGATAYEDYRELLAQPDIVAVTVSTPLKFHYDVAKAALEAGKHVLCEKPLASTPEQGEELVEIADAKGLLIAMNLGYRLEENAILMNEVLRSDEIGELHIMRFVYNWGSHGVVGPWGGERRARGLQESGGVLDCAVHFLDLARFFSDSEFHSVSAQGQWVEPEFRWPDHAMVTARMENGVLAHIENSYAYGHRCPTQRSFMQYDLIGDRGFVTWCSPLRTPESTFENYVDELHIYNESGTKILPFKNGKQFGTVYRHWAECLTRGSMEGSPLASGRDGNIATRWMWRILDLIDRERNEFQSQRLKAVA